MTQQSHSWAYIQIKRFLKKTQAPTCSLQHYSQQPRHGNNLNVHQQMNELRCGIQTQWNTTLSKKRTKQCHLQQHGWNQRLSYWNLIYGTNEPFHRKETHGLGEQTCDCQGGGGGSGMDWESGVNRCKLLYLDWISNEILMYSTGNCIQSLVMKHDGG